MVKAHAKQRLGNETWKGEKMCEKWRRNEKRERDEIVQKKQGKKRQVHARRRLLRGWKTQDIGRLYSEFLHYWFVYALNYK